MNQLDNLRVNLTIISLMEGDITEMAVDAVVNPANTGLQLGGGVAGAIARKGGPSIQQECDRIGPIKTGEAVITGGGDLRAPHVIHAVGPRMGEGDEERKLAAATRNALRAASEQNLIRIALPAISTGIFGFPKDRCAAIMLQTAVDFCRREKTSLRQIVFCLYGAETYDLFKAELVQQRLIQARPEEQPAQPGAREYGQ